MHHLIGSDWYYSVVNALMEVEFLRTYQVARLLDIKTSKALKLMKAMEQVGVVKKGGYSYSNCYQWTLTGQTTKQN